MQTSTTTTKIIEALIKFQDKIEVIKKTAENPYHNSVYADLPSILNVIKPHLKAVDLVIAQFPDGDGLTTRIMHKSGEWMEATYAMHPSNPNNPQAVGSAITYARRYAIGSILSLNIAADDDGNAASVKPGTGAPQQRQPNPPQQARENLRDEPGLTRGAPIEPQPATHGTKTGAHAAMRNQLDGYKTDPEALKVALSALNKINIDSPDAVKGLQAWRETLTQQQLNDKNYTAPATALYNNIIKKYPDRAVKKAAAVTDASASAEPQQTPTRRASGPSRKSATAGK